MSEGRTALVLSAGGTLGALQVGTLKALMATGFEWDFIVGSSVGALNGAFICGYEDPAVGLQELEEAWGYVHRRHIFPISLPQLLRALFGRAPNLVPNHALRGWIDRHLRAGRLEALSGEMHVIVTDALTGWEEVHSEGPALELLMASSAIPVIFPPVRVGDRWYMDGGVGLHTPLDAAVRLGADRIVVLTTSSVCFRTEPAATPGEVLNYAYNVLVQDNLRHQVEHLVGKVELLIPPLASFREKRPGDFSGSRSMIELAENAARAWIQAGGLEDPKLPPSLDPALAPALA